MLWLEITIPTAAEWPTRGELTARNALEASLTAAGVGQCTGAGGGRGQMDLSYRVSDQSLLLAAQALIAEAMKTHMPNSEYSVKIREEQQPD